jgi:hypothetical protein
MESEADLHSDLFLLEMNLSIVNASLYCDRHLFSKKLPLLLQPLGSGQYVFTVRSGSRALAYQWGLETVENIYGKLTNLDHYIEDRCNETNGFKRGWFLEGSTEARKTLREHVAEFKQIVDTNSAFFPPNEYYFQTILNLASREVEEMGKEPSSFDDEQKRETIES